MCTKDDIVNTGINIDTVNESKLNAHNILSDSKSIHLNNFMVTGILFIPTSIKVRYANKVVISIQVQVTNCEPFTPIFLPKNPETIEPNKGNIIIVIYII